MRGKVDTRVLDRESLNPLSPDTPGWVSRILSISADGSSAVCVVFLPSGAAASYSVYEVSLAEGRKRKIAELPHTFL
jgi:hypothetical protein